MLNDIQITSDCMSRWVVPPYFKNHSVPIVSYSYTNSIGRKIFNYKEAEIMNAIGVLGISGFKDHDKSRFGDSHVE
jgi:hypothetical protein